MQLILAAITIMEAFFTMYMISNVIMTLYQITLSKKQKVLFAFINGPLFQTAFVYAVYYLGGGASFSPLLYLLVVNVNPIGALIYYRSAQHILKLSKQRSVKLMRYMLIGWAILVTIGKLLNGLFRTQSHLGYNYLEDAARQVIMVSMVFVAYTIGQNILKKKHVVLKFTDTMFFNKRRELFIYYAEATCICAISVIVPSVVADQIAANTIVVLLLLLYMAGCICKDAVTYYKQAISNRDMHIGALFRGMEELRGVKHDFNNILHTYSGYLELKEYEKLEAYHALMIAATSHSGSIVDLARKMQENPQIISLLIQKLQYAEQMSVKLLVSLKCSLKELYIDNVEVAKILSFLLDNAIETASLSEQRRAYFTAEAKPTGSILIIVANSILESAQESALLVQARAAERVENVRDIMDKYGNCLFQMEYRDREVSAYLELCNT